MVSASYVNAGHLCSYFLIIIQDKKDNVFYRPLERPLWMRFSACPVFYCLWKRKLLWRGTGGSRQKLYFLPEVPTDFIFSIIGEELGLIGVFTVVGVFVWLFIKGIKLSARTEDLFSYFLTIGLTMMIGVQAIINFAVSTGLMPTKGLPLPFISYGGSALLINMAAAGILLNIAQRNDSGPVEMDTTSHGQSLRNNYMRRMR